MIRTSRFSNQCRSCRRTSSNLTPLLAKLEDFQKLTIKQCIETALGMPCELNSNLPSKFCDMCIDELKITYIFAEKYRESDLFYKGMVLQAMRQKEKEDEELEIIQKEVELEIQEPEEQQLEIPQEECEIEEKLVYYGEENVDVLEGYEGLVLEENEENWIESKSDVKKEEEVAQIDIVEEEIVDEDESQTVFGELEDIIVEEIDESELPSILGAEDIPINEEEVQTEEEPLEKFKPTYNLIANPRNKRKMVFSIAEATKSDGSPIEIQDSSQYFGESDNTEDLEQISVSKRQPQLSLEDLEKKNVIPTIKTIPPSKIEGGSTVLIDGETYHKCDECDRKFTKRYLLKSHIKTVHMRIREHSCTICPKQFTSKLRLEEHFRIHTGERPFKCFYCPMAFTTPTQRKLHSITHTRSNPYSCEHCGKTFSSHATLHGHKFIHTRQGVECPVCKKMFARQVDVKKHMAVHTKEKSFVCKICDKGYLYNTSLKAHMKNHSFENVQCKECEEDIHNIDQWNYHQQLHAKEVFECTSCGTTFMEQHELFTHLRTAHSTLDMTQQVKNNSWIDN